MASITLIDIRRAVEDLYGPFIVEGVPGGDVTLVNALRLPEEKRRRLASMQEDQDDPTGGGDALLREMIRIIAATTADADRLLAAIGDDAAAIAVLLNEYGSRTQMGNPSPSAS